MPGELEEKVAKFLKKRRGSETFTSFARKLGITASTLHRLEHKVQSPTLRLLQQISSRLKYKVENILFPEQMSPVLKEISKAPALPPTKSAKYAKKKRKPAARRKDSKL